jgi:hypothetical protein
MKQKHFWIEFNSCLVSYVTANNIKQAIKLAKLEFPEHFTVTKYGEHG